MRRSWLSGSMQFIAIIGLSILSCVIYGVLHDQITARICVEYFTIGHAPLLNTTSPTLLGLGWGVVATWWVGFILGLPLAIASRAGSWPKRSARSLVRPVMILMLVSAACAAIGGAMGHFMARSGQVWLLEPLASRVPQDRHVAFLTDLWAHSASYLVGFVGGVVLVLVIHVGRARAARQTDAQLTDGQVFSESAPSTDGPDNLPV